MYRNRHIRCQIGQHTEVNVHLCYRSAYQNDDPESTAPEPCKSSCRQHGNHKREHYHYSSGPAKGRTRMLCKLNSELE